MRIVYNNIIPFKGFKCINLFGVLFVRKGCTMSDKDFNHEAIHTAQMKEMLYLFFYLAYLMEWIIKLIRLRNSLKAYYEISFEKEAYRNEGNLDYLKHRKHYNQYKNQ